MSTNVGNLAVGLGYDLSALQTGGAEAVRTVTTQTEAMSAQMKRTSREGAESFRLIDEALGIHVSRPLTRIVGQTQTLGPLLASVFEFSAIGALGMVFAEQAKKVLEVTGALDGWKEILGIAGDTAEQVAKQMGAADEEVIKNLKRKIEMQDAYNRLVLGLKGGDFERAHIDLLKQETAEIEKQIVLQNSTVQQKADDSVGWRTKVSKMSPDLAGLLTIFGQGPTKDMMEAQTEANKLAEAMKPLHDALKQIDDEIQKSVWTKFRDDADEAAKAAKAAHEEMVRDFQQDAGGWNEAANLLFKVAQMMESLPQTTRKFSTFALPAAIAPPGGAPKLADLVELQKVTDDQNESWKKAGEVVEQLESPMEKYKTQLAIVTQLQKDDRISSDQLTLATGQLNEQLEQAENKMEKLLKAGGFAGGFQAFKMQLQGQGTKATDGQFTFDLLNKGLQGFEDETVKALTGAKTNWASFFESLDQMALKFVLNKMISSLLTGGGFSNIFSGIFGGAGGGGGAIGGGSWANVSGVLSDSGISQFASGTDFAPGGLSLIGEQGPELMNVPMGSSITPNSALKNMGGHTVNINIDAKGGEIGVEEKIARAISDSAPHIITRAVVEASEIQRRTPR